MRLAGSSAIWKLETMPGQLVIDYCWKAVFHMPLGEFDAAMRNVRRAIAVADSTGLAGMMTVAQQIEGSMLFEWGSLERARELFQARHVVPGVELGNSSIGAALREFYLGLLDAAAGDLQTARQAAKRLEELLPVVRGESLKAHALAANWLALLRAEIFLADGRPGDAIRCIAKELTLIVPSNGPPLFYTNAPFAQDVLARAYEAKGDLDRAATEYKRLLAFDPASTDRRLKNPRYEYRLAKILEKNGRSAEAFEHYSKFLEYWKNADPDIPELIDAKARVAALERSPGTL